MMKSAKSIGRLIGVLLLLQMAGGLVVNFVLLEPVFSAPGGYLVNAAAHPLQMGFAVLIGIAAGALSVAVAIAALPVFRRHSEVMAFGFLALASVVFALSAIEHATTLSLLSLSQAYTQAPAADAVQFEVLRGVVAWDHNWTHYVNIIVAGCTFFLFYSVLYRFALVPRMLAALTLLAALFHITAFTMLLFGRPFAFLMILPLALAHLLLVLWLLVKGFAEHPEPSSVSPE